MAKTDLFWESSLQGKELGLEMWALRFKGASSSASCGLQQMIRCQSWMSEAFLSLLFLKK